MLRSCPTRNRPINREQDIEIIPVLLDSNELSFALEHFEGRTPAAKHASLGQLGDSGLGAPRLSKPDAEGALIRTGDGVVVRDTSWYTSTGVEVGAIGRVASVSFTGVVTVQFFPKSGGGAHDYPFASAAALALAD